jgi:hypothetical protein
LPQGEASRLEIVERSTHPHLQSTARDTSPLRSGPSARRMCSSSGSAVARRRVSRRPRRWCAERPGRMSRLERGSGSGLRTEIPGPPWSRSAPPASSNADRDTASPRRRGPFGCPSG